jgi:AcrR family transcriptional regulator
LAARGLNHDPEGDTMADRILDAALQEMLEFGIRRFSVEDVARRAGINRITVYRRFSGKDLLVRSVILRETRRLFERISDAVTGLASPGEQLAEGFAVGLVLARGHALLKRVLATEPEMVASLVLTHGGSVIALASSYLSGYIRRAQSPLDPAPLDADVVAELAVRMSMSLLVAPESCIPLATADDARAFALRYLVPAVQSGTPW